MIEAKLKDAPELLQHEELQQNENKEDPVGAILELLVFLQGEDAVSIKPDR